MSDKTTQEAMEDLREAWLNFAYQLLKPLVALVERIPGLKVKTWVRERQIRERH